MHVPCNGCTLCCQNDLLRLLPGDDPSQYETMPHPLMPGQLALAHKPEGSCVYLGSTGCSIHERRPQMCREMDCRIVAQRMTFTQAQQYNIVAVWRRGRELSTKAKE